MKLKRNYTNQKKPPSKLKDNKRMNKINNSNKKLNKSKLNKKLSIENNLNNKK